MVRIRIGVTELTNPEEGYYVRVAQIIVHEAWDRKSNDNDIALYKTDRPIRYKIAEESGKFLVNSICLPRESYTDPDFATVAGWGRVAANKQYMTALQKAIVPKFNLIDCLNNYQEKITDKVICYGGGGDKDSCDVIDV